MLVPVRNASALDVVALVNRLLTDTAPPGRAGAQPTRSSASSLVADPRSNSILIRADNPARGARVRQLIEQLDTPATRRRQRVHRVSEERRCGARAPRRCAACTAATARSAGRARRSPRHFPLSLGDAGRRGVGGFPASAQRPVRLRRSRGERPTTAFSAGGAMIQADIDEQRADHHGARAGLQQPARGDRAARRAPRAGLRRGADRRGIADKAAEFGIQWQVLSGDDSQPQTACRVSAAPTSARAAAATTSSTHRVNLGSRRAGPEPRHHQRHDHDSRPRRHQQPRPARPRARERRDANILSTPTLLTLDNEEARIIVGQNVPFITGQYATTGSTATVHAVPDDRAHGRRPRAAREAADHRRRHDAAGIYQEVSRVAGHVDAAGPDPVKRALESIGHRRRSADRRARRPDPGQLHRRHREAAVRGRHAGVRHAVPLRHALAAEDQPDDLPQADDRARRRPRAASSRPSATTTCAASS